MTIHFHEATRAPELEALSRSTEGWIGGDCGCTVRLSGDRLLWFFGDTLIGQVIDGRRSLSAMAPNSIAVQDLTDINAPVRFVVKSDANNVPVAWLRPDDPETWFWVLAASRVGEKVFLHVTQVAKSSGGQFGFQPCGQFLGIVENSVEDPSDWNVTFHPIPFTRYTSKLERTFGVCALVDDGYLYVYGTDEDVSTNPRRRDLTVARAPADTVEDFTSWRFWSGARWLKTPERAARIVQNCGSEGSVHYLASIRRYVLIYSPGGISAEIVARTARKPWGPWSEPTTIYICPEMDVSASVFTYAAKAQPHLARSEDELVINYYANAYSLEPVIDDPAIYVPKFVRVKVSGG